MLLFPIQSRILRFSSTWHHRFFGGAAKPVWVWSLRNFHVVTEWEKVQERCPQTKQFAISPQTKQFSIRRQKCTSNLFGTWAQWHPLCFYTNARKWDSLLPWISAKLPNDLLISRRISHSSCSNRTPIDGTSSMNYRLMEPSLSTPDASKCIHELCTITLVFHSYLHHIRGILLLFNDFW